MALLLDKVSCSKWFKKIFTLKNFDELWTKCKVYAENEFESTRSQRLGADNLHSVLSTKQRLAKWANSSLKLSCEVSATNVQIPTAKFTLQGKKLGFRSGEHKVAVKTQDSNSAARFGSSWVFQKGGNGYGHRDPLTAERVWQFSLHSTAKQVRASWTLRYSRSS